ncbi:hypothetical protein BKA67DRAFT_659538 [Truncatella angustata]|uniref:Uncharacterized protein n=1 Tax=Truncatella angustata TaxID=152316 RepID=A0A9P8ZVS0_9PEZI|nr:uncharacterized protein BKA67DRAFT_659538 [Truncatella angustata]KAH6652875.1 hypothetical protein BKA67DRAFT_659538 [Truncatella angustata]
MYFRQAEPQIRFPYVSFDTDDTKTNEGDGEKKGDNEQGDNEKSDDEKVETETHRHRLLDNVVHRLHVQLEENLPDRGSDPLVTYSIKGRLDCRVLISVQTYAPPERPVSPWLTVEIKHNEFNCTCIPSCFAEMSWRLKYDSPLNQQLRKLEDLPFKFWVDEDVKDWDSKETEYKREIREFVWRRVLAWILTTKKAFRLAVPESLSRIDMTVWKDPRSGENVIQLADFLGYSGNDDDDDSTKGYAQVELTTAVSNVVDED